MLSFILSSTQCSDHQSVYPGDGVKYSIQSILLYIAKVECKLVHCDQWNKTWKAIC